VERASKVALPDFTLRFEDQPLIGLELKAGPGAAGRGGIGSPMSEFQLDTSDCDDISSVWDRLRVPLLVVHAQLRTRPTPPTAEAVGTAIWFVDTTDMLGRQRAIRRRSLEARDAVFYDVRMFESISELPVTWPLDRMIAERDSRREGGGLTLYERSADPPSTAPDPTGA